MALFQYAFLKFSVCSVNLKIKCLSERQVFIWNYRIAVWEALMEGGTQIVFLLWCEDKKFIRKRKETITWAEGRNFHWANKLSYSSAVHGGAHWVHSQGHFAQFKHSKVLRNVTCKTVPLEWLPKIYFEMAPLMVTFHNSYIAMMQLSHLTIWKIIPWYHLISQCIYKFTR